MTTKDKAQSSEGGPESARVSGGNKQTKNNKRGLTEQGDVVPVLRVDDPHGRLVEAQLPCVSLERARDGAVRRVWEVNEALKTERRDELHDEQERTTRLHKYQETRKSHLGAPGGQSGPPAHS